jgi:hypothetical protein
MLNINLYKECKLYGILKNIFVKILNSVKIAYKSVNIDVLNKA